MHRPSRGRQRLEPIAEFAKSLLLTLNLRGASVRLTVSIGVANRLPQEDAASLYRRADAALYRAKRTGRNAVVVARDLATAAEPGTASGEVTAQPAVG